MCVIKIVSNLIIMILLLAPAVWADDQKITYALFSREWPPLEMTEGGDHSGLALDLLQAILPDGIEMAVDVMPAPRVRLYSAESGVYTRLEAKEWMRDDVDVLWSDPVLPMVTALYSSSGRPVEYDGAESLHGKVIGCIRNYTYPAFEDLFRTGKATRYDVNCEEVLLRMLNAERVDVIGVDLIGINWVIRNAEGVEHEDLHKADNPVSVVDLRFAFNRVEGWKERLPEINANIQRIRTDGTLELLLEKYK